MSDCCGPENSRVSGPGEQKAAVIEGMVCYCFDHTREELEKAVVAGTARQIIDSIREKVKAKLCECEMKNPQGACCLGDVAAVVRHAQGDGS